MGRARREAMVRLVRDAGRWAWGAMLMCLARPAEGSVRVMIEWVVRTQQAVGTAVGAIQGPEQLQSALRRALNRTVGVNNVTGRMLDLSKGVSTAAAGTPPPAAATSASLDTNTVMMATAGGAGLVVLAWVVSRNTPVKTPLGQAMQAPVAPMIRVRLGRALLRAV